MELDPFIADSDEQAFLIRNFEFESGQTLDELRINFVTLGTPKRDSNGSIVNAVLLVHGTGGDWHVFAANWWSKTMFGPGQPLDLNTTFVVISDNLGAGASSKPSDGLRMNFPAYRHSDVVNAQHRLITECLGIHRLHAVMGSSYGGRLSWQWAVQHPRSIKGVVTMIASPFPAAGRRGMQDSLGLEPLMIDPTWNGGDYEQQPQNFPLALMGYWVFVDGAHHLWRLAPTREASLAYLPELAKKLAAKIDANDWIYQLRVNNHFDAAASLDAIAAQVLAIELDGDEMVPVELGQVEEVKGLLGERIDYLLINDTGRGHSALPSIIQHIGPRIGQFLSKLA